VRAALKVLPTKEDLDAVALKLVRDRWRDRVAVVRSIAAAMVYGNADRRSSQSQSDQSQLDTQMGEEWRVLWAFNGEDEVAGCVGLLPSCSNTD